MGAMRLLSLNDRCGGWMTSPRARIAARATTFSPSLVANRNETSSLAAPNSAAKASRTSFALSSMDPSGMGSLVFDRTKSTPACSTARGGGAMYGEFR